MNVSDYYEKELSYITNDDLRKIVVDVLNNSPECIIHIPASSSGRYHPAYSLGEGGLMRHTKAAVGIAHCMIQTEIFDNLLDTTLSIEERCMYADVVYSALILHDCCKPDDTEKHSTRFDHPIVAANLFKQIAQNCITTSNLEYMKFVIPNIYKAIASHMGQWNTAPYAKGIVLPKPLVPIEHFVHMCDYLASRKFLTFEFDVYDKVKR